MATKTTRRGSWRKVAPGQYVKSVGSYGAVKFGATVRVSFVPFPTCEIIDANGAHVAIPTPADAKKYITAAKKVYSKDTKADEARLQKRTSAQSKSPSTLPKWKPRSQNIYGLTTLGDDPYRTLPTQAVMSAERKLASTDEARRRKAHSIWLNGKEPGTPRDIYLRLYAADAKKYGR